jgi:hypothetical protein
MVQPILHLAIITGENLFAILIDIPARPVQFNLGRHRTTTFPISAIGHGSNPDW